MTLDYVNNMLWAPRTIWEYLFTFQFNHFTKADMELVLPSVFSEANSTLLFIMKLPRKLVVNMVGMFAWR